MPPSKNALLRHRVLDRCFGNSGRHYSINDLHEEVNHVLIENGSSGISVKTLRNDIQFFRKADGYDAPLVTHIELDPPAYRYSEPGYSINNREMDATEAEQLKASIMLLSRFRGHPGLQWLEEVLPKLSDRFGLEQNSEPKEVMAFESNIDYKGHKHITPLFNAIVNQSVLSVRYKPFVEDEHELEFHPYFLKQFNNRWFAFGYNPATDNRKWTLALDRIVFLEPSQAVFDDCNINWSDHFEEIYGVTTRERAKPVDVELLFTTSQAPYIITKPLHNSQKPPIFHEDGSLTIRLNLIPNYELETLLLGFGENVEVLKPMDLRNKINERLKRAAEKYNG